MIVHTKPVYINGIMSIFVYFTFEYQLGEATYFSYYKAGFSLQYNIWGLIVKYYMPCL